MTEDTRHWSCYTTPPARSLEIFEDARPRCPVAHSSEHDGFYMLLKYADVKNAMADNQTFSSELPGVASHAAAQTDSGARDGSAPATAHGVRSLAPRSPRRHPGKWNPSCTRTSMPTSMPLSKRVPVTSSPSSQNPCPPKRFAGSSVSMTHSFRRCARPPSKCSQRRAIPSRALGESRRRFAAVTVTEIHDAARAPHERITLPVWPPSRSRGTPPRRQ